MCSYALLRTLFFKDIFFFCMADADENNNANNSEDVIIGEDGSIRVPLGWAVERYLYTLPILSSIRLCC